MSFSALNLDARIMRAIEELGFTQATPVQEQAIPVVMNGNDLMASAQTGTGKTAAFVLPVLHKMLNVPAKVGRGPRLLILSPTRELAEQINEAIRTFSKFSRVKTAVIVGGVSYFHQERALKNPLDIIVATPGRLMDHMSKDRIDFSRMETLVLDEADRMLDMGFIEDIETIAAALPEDRQTLLFSATLEGEVLRVAKDILNEPVRIQIASVKSEHTQIEQNIMAADDVRHKQSLLRHILNQESVNQAVVFVATKTGADDLADDLKIAGIRAMSLHGDMKQQHRRRVIERMHEGKIKVLVATDVAARGLDVRGISHVVNYELPMVPEDYIHRVGRTGRGGANGEALSLITPEDWRKWFRIEKLIGKKFEEIEIDGLEPKSGRPAPRGRGEGRDSGRGRNSSGRGSSRGSGRGEFRSERRDGGRGEFRGERSESGRGEFRGERSDRFSSDDRFARKRTDRAFAGKRERGGEAASDGAPRFARSQEDRGPRRERTERSDRRDAPFRESGSREFSRDDKPRFKTRERESNVEVFRSNDSAGARPRRAPDAERPAREFSERREFSDRKDTKRSFNPSFADRKPHRTSRTDTPVSFAERQDAGNQRPKRQRRFGQSPFAENDM